MNFHLKGCLGTEFMTFKGEMMTEEALTSYTVYDAYCSFEPHAQ